MVGIARRLSGPCFAHALRLVDSARRRQHRACRLGRSSRRRNGFNKALDSYATTAGPGTSDEGEVKWLRTNIFSPLGTQFGLDPWKKRGNNEWFHAQLYHKRLIERMLERAE